MVVIYLDDHRQKRINVDYFIASDSLSGLEEKNLSDIDTYNKRLDADPLDCDALLGLAKCLNYYHAHEEQVTLLMKVLSIDATNAAAYACLGDIYTGLKAMHYYNYSLFFDPANTNVRCSLSRLYKEAGFVQKALSLLEDSTELPLMYLASTYHSYLGNDSESLSLCEQICMLYAEKIDEDFVIDLNSPDEAAYEYAISDVLKHYAELLDWKKVDFYLEQLEHINPILRYDILIPWPHVGTF
jgi:hypothetical protein